MAPFSFMDLIRFASCVYMSSMITDEEINHKIIKQINKNLNNYIYWYFEKGQTFKSFTKFQAYSDFILFNKKKQYNLKKWYCNKCKISNCCNFIHCLCEIYKGINLFFDTNIDIINNIFKFVLFRNSTIYYYKLNIISMPYNEFINKCIYLINPPLINSQYDIHIDFVYVNKLYKCLTIMEQ